MTDTRDGRAFVKGLFGGALIGAVGGVFFAPNIVHTEKYPASSSACEPAAASPRSTRELMSRRWSKTVGITEGNIMAIIMTVHMVMNITA